MSVEDFVQSQQFYNAGYAAGRRALADELQQLLDGPDQGDHEFGWKASVRAMLPTADSTADQTPETPSE